MQTGCVSRTGYCITVGSTCVLQGFKMWMDIYHMADGEESTLQTMADAVEGSAVVIMCVSESYKDSPYCRAGDPQTAPALLIF